MLSIQTIIFITIVDKKECYDDVLRFGQESYVVNNDFNYIFSIIININTANFIYRIKWMEKVFLLLHKSLQRSHHVNISKETVFRPRDSIIWLRLQRLCRSSGQLNSNS